MLRARLENQNSRPLWNSSEAKIATSTVGTAAIAVNKRDQTDVQPSAAEPSLLRPPHRDLARIKRHQRDRRQQDSRSAAARSAAATASVPGSAPRLSSQTLKRDHPDQEQPQSAPPTRS